MIAVLVTFGVAAFVVLAVAVGAAHILARSFELRHDVDRRLDHH